MRLSVMAQSPFSTPLNSQNANVRFHITLFISHASTHSLFHELSIEYQSRCCSFYVVCPLWSWDTASVFVALGFCAKRGSMNGIIINRRPLAHVLTGASWDM